MKLRDTWRRLTGRGGEEQRAITSLPWDVGGPLRPSIVSAEQALGLVPVFAAVRLLASQIASLPLQGYRKFGPPGGEVRTRIATPSLFVAPSVHGTLYDWLHRAVTSLALRGNAFGYIATRNADQYPTTIEWLHPDDVWVDDTATSGPGSYSQPTWYWQGRVVPGEDILHIAWFTTPGRVLGLSPIGACAATLSTGLSAQDYTARWFDNGAVPPGKFRNTQKTVNQKEASEIGARLNAAIRTRKPLVYGNDWEYEPIAVAAAEAKFVETLRLNATQIASIYGIPPEMIGGDTGSSLTYSTVEQNALNFVKFTLRPWLELLEEAFFPLVPRPQYVRFNIDALLRTDLQTRMASYQTARDIGLNNIDELRALEDEPPLPGGQGQDYTPLKLQGQASAGPNLRSPGRYVIEGLAGLSPGELAPRTNGHPKGQPLHGTTAMLALEARRDDPSHPAAMERKFDPLQPRNPHSGEWLDTTPGDGGASKLRDALKLAGKIDLERGEKLAGSQKLDGDFGTIRVAATDRDGSRFLRIGIGGPGFGSRDDEAGPWRGGPDRTAQLNAGRKRLRDEQKALEAEWDRLDNGVNNDPARKAAIEARLDELDELDTGEVYPSGYTANLEQEPARRLHAELSEALSKGRARHRERSAIYDRIDELEAQRDKMRVPGGPKWTDAQEARWDDLTAQVEALQQQADALDYEVFAEGSIAGQWADVHYRVDLDDGSIGVQVYLGAVPHDDPDINSLEDLSNVENAASFDVDAAERLLKLLERYTNPPARSVPPTPARGPG